MNIALDQMLEKSAKLLKMIEDKFEAGLLELYLIEIRGLTPANANAFIRECCYKCYSYTYEEDGDDVLRHYVLVHTTGGDNYNIPDDLDIDLRWLYDEDWREIQITEKKAKLAATMKKARIDTQLRTIRSVVTDIGVANSKMKKFAPDANPLPLPPLPEHLIEEARKDSYLKTHYKL